MLTVQYPEIVVVCRDSGSLEEISTFLYVANTPNTSRDAHPGSASLEEMSTLIDNTNRSTCIAKYTVSGRRGFPV